MKIHFCLVIFFCLLMNCSKDDSVNIIDKVEEEINLPPSKFSISVLEISDNKVKLSWDKSIDPESESVTYSVILNNEIKIENTVENEYTLTNLSELSEYTCKVIAKDNKGNMTIEEVSFTTKKYYLKFLKEFYTGDSEANSTIGPTHMIRTKNGDYVITGSSSKPDRSGSQSYILRMDKEGNEIWKNFYGNKVNSSATFKITELKDGGFVLATFHLIMKFDEFGNRIWSVENEGYINRSHTTSMLTYGEMYSAKEDSQGNIFVVGWRGPTFLSNEILHYGVLTKVSSAGQIIWDKEFIYSYLSTFNDLIIESNDDVVILGTIETAGATKEKVIEQGSSILVVDTWVLKTNNDGNIIWQKIIDGYGYGFATEIIKTRDNNYATVGFSLGGYDIGSGFISKISSEGDEMWSAGIPLWSVLSLAETSDGGFITTGHSAGGSYDVLGITKLTSTGAVDWSRTYQQSFTHLRGKSIFETQDNGFMFCASFAQNYGGAKILVYKTDPEGNFE
ncbi:fibronectin type III domain-containing protein [Gelidibacter sp. F2691]|nr:fibronectin type III domain-containing protein [Gelidibacter sp. F2691]